MQRHAISKSSESIARPDQALAIVFAMGLVLMTACKPTNPDTSPLLKQGSFPFAFEPNQVSEITIAKNDLKSQDAWTYRIVRVEDKTSRAASPRNENKTALWEIAQGVSLKQDRQADPRYLSHLLDTLLTLKVQEVMSDQEPSARGLVPPWFALRWIAGQQSYELQLSQTRDPRDRSCYAKIGSSPTLYQVIGATLPLLDYLTSNAVLRNRVLLTWDIDQIDEFEVRTQGLRRYGERQTNGWVTQDGKHYPDSAQAWLEALTHLQISEFLESDFEPLLTKKALDSSQAVKITFKDRFGKALHLKMAWVKNRLIASVSNRDPALFELFPGAAKYLLKTSLPAPKSKSK